MPRSPRPGETEGEDGDGRAREVPLGRHAARGSQRRADPAARHRRQGDDRHGYFTKGTEVPLHRHDNEQLTYILEGTLQFFFGEDDEQTQTVHAGEVLVIRSDLPHRAVALEDTLDVDVFAPPRQDWLDGTDTYLRKGATTA